MLKAATLFITLAAATASVAGPARLNDVQYLQAARCEALIASPALGGGDAASITALMKAQRQGRADYIFSKADELRDQAARQARHAEGYLKEQLMAERNGACQALLGEAPARTAGGSPTPNTAN